ncbi:hypothetical protein ACWGCW_38155 [Streptomyces sp. NPDC054933]
MADASQEVARAFLGWSRSEMGGELLHSTPPAAAMRTAWRALPRSEDEDPTTAVL